MKWQEDPRLWTLIQQVLTNPEVRREIVGKGANNYLKERGVDLPIDIDPVRLVAMCLITIVICVLAALAPALRASHLDPVAALREE